MNKNVKFIGDLTPEALENIAKNANFSSVQGDEDDDDNFEGEDAYEGEDGYTGANDDLVDFGGTNQMGAASFLSKHKGGRKFTITMENTATLLPLVNSLDKFIVLNPGYTSEGRKAGAIIMTDGSVIYDVPNGGRIIFSGAPKTIANFLAFIDKNPTEILGFKVKARSFTDSIEQSVNVRELSPFKTLEDKDIFMSTFQDENTYQPLVVTVPERIAFNNQNEVGVTLLANEKLTVTFFIGGILNTSVSLEKKHIRAKKTLMKRK